ncbi:nucleotidyl transferase AbiEii/AbiGii toxin family protein [Bradyrhizobium sp. DASA03005]|uniref:nucleotidyl transferase AbiEii/AbiGii toxin family protein n=1 Tax=Bradyrhizobium sp. SPXBL-02 TaxID=3395912 RepID=UPI003F71E99B
MRPVGSSLSQTVEQVRWCARLPNSGRPAHLLEKDVWVVWCLDTHFSSPLDEHLVFKGGTSLSKAYRAIRRFSEDVDLTYDIRAIAPDLVTTSDDNPVPQNRGQGRKWSAHARERLPIWVRDEALPVLNQRLQDDKLNAKAEAKDEKIFVTYDPLETGSGYVSSAVMLEFGARSTGEPSEVHDVVCDAAQYLETLEFPTAKPKTMKAERNFWEKATAMHVFCVQGKLKGERFARHWYDLVRCRHYREVSERPEAGCHCRRTQVVVFLKKGRRGIGRRLLRGRRRCLEACSRRRVPNRLGAGLPAHG